MRARYNIEEITATSQPPRDELSAPLVGGRDFVKDRIMLDLAAAQERLTTAEKVYSETERRARVGAAFPRREVTDMSRWRYTEFTSAH